MEHCFYILICLIILVCVFVMESPIRFSKKAGKLVVPAIIFLSILLFGLSVWVTNMFYGWYLEKPEGNSLVMCFSPTVLWGICTLLMRNTYKSNSVT